MGRIISIHEYVKCQGLRGTLANRAIVLQPPHDTGLWFPALTRSVPPRGLRPDPRLATASAQAASRVACGDAARGAFGGRLPQRRFPARISEDAVSLVALCWGAKPASRRGPITGASSAPPARAHGPPRRKVASRGLLRTDLAPRAAPGAFAPRPRMPFGAVGRRGPAGIVLPLGPGFRYNPHRF
jgi:hypothetical protein